MAGNSENSNNNHNYLREPPEQTVPGVILYHPDTEMDARIRQVAILAEGGYDLDTICKTVGRSTSQVKTYFRQIRIAKMAYIHAYPEEFDSGLEGLRLAIQDRRALDSLLRREFYHAAHDTNPSNKVGVLKLIMENMRQIEELTGLTVQRIQHSGTVSVRDEMHNLLDQAPLELREGYLDALSALVHAAEAGATNSASSDAE